MQQLAIHSVPKHAKPTCSDGSLMAISTRRQSFERQIALCIFFFFWVTGELSTLRQLMKVPNEPGLSPNNGLENVSLSDQSMASNPRKGQAKCPGAKTTSHDGRAGHVMTHMCHPSKARRMASVTIQVPMQGICTPATRTALFVQSAPFL